MNGTLEEIFKANPNSEFLKSDGFDAAVVGMENGILIYSKDKCVQSLVERDGMTEDDAEEFLEFNTYYAHFGPLTPIYR